MIYTTKKTLSVVSDLTEKSTPRDKNVALTSSK